MRTIEETAKNRAKDNYYFEGSQNFIIDMNTFKAGVEFSQRFIPVEEEKPSIGEEVLIKRIISHGPSSDSEITDCATYTGHSFVRHNEFSMKVEKTFTNVVKWRPIERQ